MPAPAVAILLPGTECKPVVDELRSGGFDPVVVADAAELIALVTARPDIAVAILDLDTDPADSLGAWAALHGGNRSIPALVILGVAMLDHIADEGRGHPEDEFVTRPYAAESIRWRVEAMCIRSVAADAGAVDTLEAGGAVGASDWAPRGALVAVFNPKGGVGKTMIATNLAATLVARRAKQVLLVDADTVTGHVTTSLGMEGAATVVDAWRDELDGGAVLRFDQLASNHASGLRVLALASSPIHTEILEPQRVAGAITVTRRGVDYVIVDLHPSYSPLNRAIFDRADRILVPVTPDLPAIRAAVQLRDVAGELGMLDKLALVVNRANSGVSVTELEQTVGMSAFATIRSGGMLLVRSTNEGRPLVDLAPREKIAQDFEALADRIVGTPAVQPDRAAFRLFGRATAAVRT
jgi:Flp pilus assembly CpaE family ATPase